MSWNLVWSHSGRKTNTIQTELECVEFIKIKRMGKERENGGERQKQRDREKKRQMQRETKRETERRERQKAASLQV